MLKIFVIIISTILVVITFRMTNSAIKNNDVKGIQFLFCCWVILPPLWFSLEYFFLYRRDYYPNYNLEQFKYGQEISRNMWIAGSTVLGFILNSMVNKNRQNSEF